jgi:DNA-directed RNA polymerase sigma subunit (sigma70/sigma32)
MSRAITWPMLTAESASDHYFKDIQRFPMLDPQEEYMLAKRWREAGDRDAAHRLIISHLRLVAKIARGYRGYGLPLADLISEGHVGLMQAIERFEPERGFRFSTYAVWWIVVLGALTPRERRIFEGRRLAEDPITLAELADEFGVSRERVRQIEVRAFEKVQKAVKNRVATIETPAHTPMH